MGLWTKRDSQLVAVLSSQSLSPLRQHYIHLFDKERSHDKRPSI